MEWLKTIIEKHTTDGNTDIEAVMNAVNTEFPKHAVTKVAYKEQSEKLKNATDTLEKLQAEHAGNEALQAELLDYKNKVTALETEAKETAKKQSIKDALTAAKATDVDYLMYKLGDLETAEDGSIVDLENKIKDLQVNHPTFFQAAESQEAATTDGFQFLGGADLPSGKVPQPLDIASAIANPSVNLTDLLNKK